MKSLKPWASAAWLFLAFASIGMKAGVISLHGVENVPLCLFRFWTGLPCPGCGMTHALIAAFQGQWRLSYGSHPMGIPVLVVWTSWLLFSSFAPERWKPVAYMKGLRPWAEGALLAAILLVYAIGIKTGTLCRF